MKKLFSVFAGAYPSVESCYKDDLRDRALELFKKSKLYETTAETLSDAMQSFVLSSVFREFIDYKFRNEYSLF